MSSTPVRVLLLAFALLGIHLNYWMWDDSRIVLGLPVNLLYHAAFSLALYPVMLLVVRRAWPSYLEDD